MVSFCCRIFGSSIGRKAVVALAGLLLCGFLVSHLAGNLLLLAGEGTFNTYAKALESNPLLPIAELILAGIFLAHILVSAKLTWENRRARPVGYVMKESKGGRTAGSRTMALTGTLVLAFLIVHLKTFKFVDHSAGMYRVVMDAFQNRAYALFYVVAMAGIGLHLSHGFQSAFQTFGVSHPRYKQYLKLAGWGFSLVVAGGFAALPLWAHFCMGGR